MGFFDKEMSAVRNKPWLVSLICTLFVLYPNIAWYHCDSVRLMDNQQVEFFFFFIFRLIFIWGFIRLLLYFNLHRFDTPSFSKRLFQTAGLSILTFVIYKGITSLIINYDAFLSILIFQWIVIWLICVFIGYINVLYTSQWEKEEEIKQLRLENLQSRYDALANQINPHFFFNSLNGISSLIRKKNDDNTLEYVNKLSDIFRYILQSDKKGIVSLDEELDFVESFSHVMEVRFANKLTFTVDVPEEKRNLQLPVLSLLPLIENVTVHNMIDSDHRMNIQIRLNEQNELVISNPIYPKLTPPDTNGTGLKNLENRFQLLMNKQIRIASNDNTFMVYLPLK